MDNLEFGYKKLDAVISINIAHRGQPQCKSRWFSQRNAIFWFVEAYDSPKKVIPSIPISEGPIDRLSIDGVLFSDPCWCTLELFAPQLPFVRRAAHLSGHNFIPPPSRHGV
ncbi:hypothetical protein TNCV_5077331 [Trichonephila clavipes]|uniref:Uncharacterized protein n=1 Tax=Trichonephila clavipes TaxID=2585209 RepID=A0A8X6S3C6_TRICX|nr:hypothetical protein TNCV_5077331 [Trichonephila clavipes]